MSVVCCRCVFSAEYLESDDDLIEKHVALPATRPDGRSADPAQHDLVRRRRHRDRRDLRRPRQPQRPRGLRRPARPRRRGPRRAGHGRARALPRADRARAPDLRGRRPARHRPATPSSSPPDGQPWCCPRTRRPAPEGVPELRLGSGSLVDLPAVVAHLAGKVVLMEGGPSLAGQMVALGLVDEFFHTISPMVISGESATGGPRPARRRPPVGLDARLLRRSWLPVPPLRARMTPTTKGVRTMGRKYQIISGDGHLETPPDFVKYVPEKFKDRAPRLITLPDGGGDAWLMEGMPLTYASQNLKGRGVVKFAGQSYFDDDGSRAEGAGDGDPAAAGAGRRRHRRRDAVRAGVREPVPREDPRTRRVHVDGAGVQHVAVGRLLHARHPTGSSATRLMPVSGIDDAISELERAHADRASRRCSSCSSRTAVRARSPKTTGSGRRRSSSACRCRRTSGSAVHPDRRTPSRHVAVAGRSGHDPARARPAVAARWPR